MGTKILPEVIGRYKIISIFKINKRTYCSAICTNGHIKEKVRTDALKKNCDKCFECDNRNPDYKSNTYNSWDAMIQRCTNINSPYFYKYGGNGISVYADWMEPNGKGFKNFLEYMGECPEGHTLDRFPDKFGNYEPGNVRWANNSHQGFNQRRRITNTSGRTGVRYREDRGKWDAKIYYENSVICLGHFETFEEACKVREEAELKYFGYTKE